jgi:hypothetical protein
MNQSDWDVSSSIAHGVQPSSFFSLGGSIEIEMIDRSSKKTIKRCME